MKKVIEKFAGKEKMSTFAIPIEREGSSKENWCHSSVGRAKD